MTRPPALLLRCAGFLGAGLCVVSTCGCPDLVVESALEPVPVKAFAVVNPEVRTGTSLVLRWSEPVTVQGVRVCVYRENENGDPEGTAEVCTPIEGSPVDREHVVTGLIFDVPYTFQAVVETDQDVRSTPLRASGRPVADAPPFQTFTAEALRAGPVQLAWSLPAETFIASGVHIARRVGEAPTRPDDPEATVVFSGDLSITQLLDETAPADTDLVYKAWVKDREGAFNHATTAEVRTFVAGLTDLQAELLEEYGALSGEVELTWTDPAGDGFVGVTVLRTSAGTEVTGPTDPAGAVVCEAVAPGTQTCTDQAAAFGEVTYHAFTLQSGEGFAGPATETILYPDLRVTFFTAVPESGGVNLTWTLDGEATDAAIYRSSTTFPLGPEDPAASLVTSGTSSPFFDTNVDVGEIYYYAAFPYGVDATRAGPGRTASTAPFAGPVENLVVEPVLNAQGLRTGGVAARWDPPSVGSYSTSRVMRIEDAQTPPASPLEGVAVCEEAAISCVDNTAVHNTEYLYVVWARDAQGTFSDTPVAGFIESIDEAPPATVVNVMVSREVTGGGNDSFIAVWSWPPGNHDIRDVVARWSTSDYPASITAGSSAFSASDVTPGDTSRTFSAPSGDPLYVSFFTRDEANNVSPPAHALVPANNPLVLVTSGFEWPEDNHFLHWASDDQILEYDTGGYPVGTCELLTDVGADGDGPDDTVVPIDGTGHLVVAPTLTTRYTLECDDGSVVSRTLVLETSQAAWGFTVTVQPAQPSDVTALPDGAAVGLVANNLLIVEPQVDVAGQPTVREVVPLAPLTNFGVNPSPTGVATWVAAFDNGDVAVAAEAPVVGYDLPLGVLTDAGASWQAAWEAHLVGSTGAYPWMGGIVPVDTGAGAGGAVVVGDAAASLDLVQGTFGAPGAESPVTPIFGGRDAFVAAFDDAGAPLWSLVGGSVVDDYAVDVVKNPLGGYVAVVNLGDGPAAFGAFVLQEYTDFTARRVGIVELDETGAVTWGETDALLDAADAVAVGPDGSVVVVGRDSYNDPTVRRTGSAVPPAERWWRSLRSWGPLNTIPAGDIPARLTGVAFDDEGDPWVVGYAYDLFEVFGFEAGVPAVYPPFAQTGVRRSFVIEYAVDGGAPLWTNALVSPEGGDVRIEHVPSSSGPEHFWALGQLRNPTAIDGVAWTQVMGESSWNEMPSDVDLGYTGGALVKLGPVPARPAPVAGLTATLAGSGPYNVNLSWSIPADGGPTRVVLTRGVGEPPTGPFGGDVLVDAEGTAAFADTAVPTGTTLYYRVYRADDWPVYGASPLVSVVVP